MIVWYSANAGWTADRGKELDAFLARGGGLVYLHWAINGREATDALAERIGLASRPGLAKFRHGPIDLVFHRRATRTPSSPGFASAQVRG